MAEYIPSGKHQTNQASHPGVWEFLSSRFASFSQGSGVILTNFTTSKTGFRPQIQGVWRVLLGRRIGQPWYLQIPHSSCFSYHVAIALLELMGLNILYSHIILFSLKPISLFFLITRYNHHQTFQLPCVYLFLFLRT